MTAQAEADVLYVSIRAETDEPSFRQMEAEVAQSATRAGEAGGAGLSSKFSGALAALPGLAVAAATAVGAALATGLKSAVDIAAQVQQGQRDMQASLGVTAEEAKALGEVAKQVFGNNWGGSLAEAQEAVANVRREVKGLSEGDLQAVTEGSIAIAQRFGEDQAKVAASVQSLMKATGISAQEAMDFISAGFQKGLNSGDTFLDTLQEYGPQFEKAKINGSELFSLLETGAGKGALGVDKIGDTFKEFGFSLADTSEGMVAAFAQLGISQSELTAKIDSGSMTQTQAFQLVMDKLKGVQSETERMAIISQIFKGAGEDLGALASRIDLTKTKLGELGGSTQQVKDSYNSLSSVFQAAGRQALLQLQPIGDLLLDLANDAMPTVKQAINAVGPVVTQVVQTIVRGFKDARDGVGPLGQAITAVRPVVSGLGDLFQSVFALIRTLWQTVLQPTLNAILPVASTAFQGVAGVVASAVNLITGLVQTVSAIFRGDWAQAWEIFKRYATDAANGLQDTLDGIGAKVAGAAGAMFEKAKILGVKVKEGILAGMEGFQAAFFAMLSDALQKAAERVPSIMKGPFLAAAEKTAQIAQNSQAAAAQHRLNQVGTSGYVQPLNGQGPLLPGQQRTGYQPTVVQVTGDELGTLLGMGGKNRGAAFGQTYGPNGSWGAHVGEDWFAKIGTPVLAAFAGTVKLRQDAAQGNIVDLYDARGQRLSMIHLKEYAQGLEEAVKKAGGALQVVKGQVLGYVGQTGNSAHADLGTKNAHLHVHAVVDGKIVDPDKVKWVGLQNPTNDALAKSNPAVVVGGGPTGKAQPATVPLPTPAEQKAYSLSLTDWNKQSKEALEIARQLIQAETSRDQGFILRVRARADAYRGEGEAQAASLAFASEQLKKADAAAVESKQARAEAAKKTEAVEKETDLERDQRIARERVAQEALTKSLRAASTERLQAIVQEGVTAQNSLAKWEGARAELTRREQESGKAHQQTALEREQATLRETQARAALEKAIRGASDARLKDIVAAGVQQEGDLQRWQLANAELTRREQLATRAQQQAKTQQEQAAQTAQQAAERQSSSLLNTLKTRDRMMEAAAQAAQTSAQRQSDSLLKGMQERDRQLEGQQKTANQALAAAQQQGDSLLKNLRERSLTEYGDFATRWIAIAEHMVEGGDYAGGINVLRVAIADLLETSDGSETATAALNKLGDVLDKVAKARQSLTGDAKSRAEFREAIGLDTGDLTEVAARGQRPVQPAKPDPGVAARQQRPTPEQVTASPARGATDESWRNDVRGDEQMAAAKKLYTDSLREMTDAELAAEVAMQNSVGTRAKYNLAMDETTRRVQQAADMQKIWDDLDFQAWADGLKELDSDTLTDLAREFASAGDKGRELQAVLAAQKAKADEAKMGAEALAQAQVELNQALGKGEKPWQKQIDALLAAKGQSKELDTQSVFIKPP